MSAASAWEVVIKARLGRLDVGPDELAAPIDANGVPHLRFSAAHAAGVAALEGHHNNAFDRLLIAQDLAEPLKLVNTDDVLASYSGFVQLVQCFTDHSVRPRTSPARRPAC